MSSGAESDVSVPASSSQNSVQASTSCETPQAPFAAMPGSMFVNPFMSAFMPQQPADGQQQPMPAVPGMMPFSPAQYQEMMQFYFQSMMAAAQSQMGASQNMPFPMPMNMTFAPPPRPSSQASQDSAVSDVSQAFRASSLSENGHHEIPTATVAPIVPSSGCSTAESNSPLKEPSSETRSPSKESEVSPVKQQEEHQDAVQNDGSLQRKASNSDEERTNSLIQKQMSEIEKEILRRTQNKNVKQIDDHELAELIGEAAQLASEQFAAFTSGHPPDQQSALPYIPPAATETKAPSKETLNQLRSSFNLPETGPTTGPNVANFPVQPVLSQPQPAPAVFSAGHHPIEGCFGNPFTQPHLFPFAAPHAVNGHVTAPSSIPNQFSQPFSNADSFPESTTQECVPPTTVASSTEAAPKLGLAPPPQPSHPVQRRTSVPSTSSNQNWDWPEENKENGDEPVWVLRESYMKRQKRDEAAQQAEAEAWAEEHARTSSSAPPDQADDDELETDRLIAGDGPTHPSSKDTKKKPSKETEVSSSSNATNSHSHIEQIAMVHEPAVLIEGVLFRARYLGSTQMMCESRGSKAARMCQAQEAVARVKAPDGEIQPSTEIDLFISTEKIMVLNTDLQRISETDVRQDILMDHALRTISYIADIGDLVVLMARRMTASDSDERCSQLEGVKRSPKVICHVFESDEASFIAQSIGQAFQVAYMQFLRANGIEDPSYLRQIDYQEVLNSQELLGDELEMFARKETQKDVVVPKKAGEPLGIVVVESGWGSMLPTVVLAHMNPAGPAARSNLLNIGDQIININGISLVGLPLSSAQTNIKNAKAATAVRLTVVSTPPVVEVRIRRPDTKYQLGFSVQNGVICSLLRGGIAERGGIRVGHRIIEINGHSVVAVAHERIVNMLATAIGEIHMKTMPTSMFRLLTGQEVPQYI